MLLAIRSKEFRPLDPLARTSMCRIYVGKTKCIHIQLYENSSDSIIIGGNFLYHYMITRSSMKMI